MSELLARVEGEWRERERVFVAGAGGGEEEEVEEEEGSRDTVKFVISSEEPQLPARPVHMPGYPE